MVHFSLVFVNPLSIKDREDLYVFITKELRKHPDGSFNLSSVYLFAESKRLVMDKVLVYLFRHGIFFKEPKESTHKSVH